MKISAGRVLAPVLLAGCVHGPPSVAGVAGAPATPHDVWTPPAEAVEPSLVPMPAAVPAPLPADVAARVRQLRLADVVDLALRGNPATRASWAQAIAAADAYGVQRGRWFPTFDLNVAATQTQSLSTATRFGGRRRQLNPGVSLSYVLFDLGGRGGAVDAAKQAAVAAGLTHNSVLQTVVLQAETAYFDYMSTRALLDAQQASVREAQANLESAQHRHDVGLATIADVLQAKTAASQAQLALETVSGQLRAAQGALAVAMGLPANVSYDVVPPAAPVEVRDVAESVDSLIAAAVSSRPDLAAAAAQARQAAAAVRRTRGASLPTLSFSGNAGEVYSDLPEFSGNNYNLSLTVQVPVFSGFSLRYATLAARAEADAARARAEGVRQQVVNQVFTSYYALQTATQRAHTSDDLLASATQSEEVATGRYREGVGTILDLLTAQRALADARAQQVQARWDWYAALARLAYDVGVLGPAGETPIPLSPPTHE